MKAILWYHCILAYIPNSLAHFRGVLQAAVGNCSLVIRRSRNFKRGGKCSEKDLQQGATALQAAQPLSERRIVPINKLTAPHAVLGPAGRRGVIKQLNSSHLGSASEPQARGGCSACKIKIPELPQKSLNQIFNGEKRAGCLMKKQVCFL